MNKLWGMIQFWMMRKTFARRKSQIYAQMAFAMEHDTNIRDELENMVKVARVRKSDMYPVYQRWLNLYRGKASGRLSQSMADTVSKAELSLISSAEETQHLAEGFRFLAKSTKQISEMQRAVLGALTSIILPLLMLIGLMLGIDNFFFPIVEESIPKAEWGFVPTLVAKISHNIASLIGAGLVILPIVFVFWYRSLSRWSGNGRLFAEKTFFYNKYRDFNCAIFLVNLAFLMEAGKPPREALETILGNSSNYIKWHLSKMLQNMDKDARNMGGVLVSTGLFSQQLGDLLTNYARWTDWHTQISDIAFSALDLVVSDVLEVAPKVQEGLKLMVGLVVFLVMGTVGLIVMTLMQKSGIR